jgi:hypothetical protein
VSRRVGLGVKIENDPLASELREAYGVAVLVGKLEVGSGSA